MKTDAGKYLMRIERTQDYLEKVSEINNTAEWEDLTGTEAINAIIQWAIKNGYDPTTELYFKARQIGRVAMAKEALNVLGRRDKGND